MKRRSFLSLLGLAPAAPLIAKEIAKAVPAIDAADVVVPPSMPQRIVSYAPSDTNWFMCTMGTAPNLQEDYTASWVSQMPALSDLARSNRRGA